MRIAGLDILPAPEYDLDSDVETPAPIPDPSAIRANSCGAWRVLGTPLVLVAELRSDGTRDFTRWHVQIDATRTIPDRKAWEKWTEDCGYGSIGVRGRVYRSRGRAAEAAARGVECALAPLPRSLPMHTEPQERHRWLYPAE